MRRPVGLAITKHLVEAQDGRIEVSGPPGEGATFTIRLPPYDREPVTV